MLAKPAIERIPVSATFAPGVQTPIPATAAVPDRKCRPGTALPARARAFSLVELLVASALSLVVLGAVATLFGVFGRSVSDGQSVVELNARMRNAAWRLRQDLAGHTAPATELLRVEANAGYFQVIDTGSTSDVLALTTASRIAPFVGRLQGTRGLESPTAEVIWFCEPDGGELFNGQTVLNLHRRQLLVAAAPDTGAFTNAVSTTGSLATFLLTSDLSCRTESGRLFANSLGDLTMQAARLPANARRLQGPRQGEDIILGGVLSFDVRLMEGGPPVNKSFETRENGPAGSPPLRGIEVRIRCVDASTSQVRQVTVVHSFPPG